MRGYFYRYLKELAKYDKSIEFDEFNNPVYKYFSYYFQEKTRDPFFFMIDEKVVGLSLVRMLKNKHYEIAEFYILDQYRKDKNALSFALGLVHMYEGIIEFSCVENNVRAVRFWDKFSSRFDNPKREENSERITWYIENKSKNDIKNRKC